MQCFEYTYELAWNVIKDFFESQGENGILGSRDAFRLAFRRGLLSAVRGTEGLVRSDPGGREVTGGRFGLPDHAVDKIRQVLAVHPEVERAVVYGSRAKGSYRNGSDIDLTLFGEALTHRVLVSLLVELDDLLLPWMIDLSIFADLRHQALQEHIERVGQVLYAKDAAP